MQTWAIDGTAVTPLTSVLRECTIYRKHDNKDIYVIDWLYVVYHEGVYPNLSPI